MNLIPTTVKTAHNFTSENYFHLLECEIDIKSLRILCFRVFIKCSVVKIKLMAYFIGTENNVNNYTICYLLILKIFDKWKSYIRNMIKSVNSVKIH